MITRDDIANLRETIKDATDAIKKAERELKRQEAKPYRIFDRVKSVPFSMPVYTGGDVITKDRILVSNGYSYDVWPLITKLAKNVVSTRSYIQRDRRSCAYSGNFFDTSSDYTNRFEEMSNEQLDAVVAFCEDIVSIYNQHFIKNHTHALVKFNDEPAPMYVPVVVQDLT